MKRVIAYGLCAIMTTSMLMGCAKDRIEEIESTETEVAETVEEVKEESAAKESSEEEPSAEAAVAEEKNDELKDIDLKITARTVTTKKDGDILIVDYDVTNNSDDDFFVPHLYNAIYQNGEKLEDAKGNSDSQKKDGVEYRSTKITPGMSVVVRDEVVLKDLKSQVVLGGDNLSKSKCYVQLEDAVTENDAEVIVATPYDDPSDLKCDVETAVLGVTFINEHDGALYVFANITNNGDEEYDLKELDVDAVQNGNDLKLGGMGSTSAYTRKTLQPGESDIMVAVFGMSEVGDVSITYQDTFEYDKVIASAEFTAKELVDQTKAFVNGDIDKAAITEKYVLMDDVTKQFLDDLGEAGGN